MDIVLDVTHDGTTRRVAVGEVTGIDARDLRQATGLGISQTFQLAAAGKVDLDVAATLLWLGRRQAGDKAGWDEVASTVTLSTPVEVAVVDDAGDPDPE